jgi:lysophospholipase L1-like esterase
LSLLAQIVSILLAAVCGLLILLELGLRLFIGLGNPIIYIADEKIGYLLAPSQNTRRMGNRIEINQYSMRGSSIAPQKNPSTLRVFLIGDSIANGGWWTDKDDIISALVKNRLAKDFKEFKNVEVLNASANSWGPRNQLAYLDRFGLFEAQVVVLLLNTDDLFATAPTSLPVGRDRNYPDRKPPLALVELWQQKFTPTQEIAGMAEVHAETGDRVGNNLMAIERIQAIVKQNNARLILAMTPLLREVEKTGSRDYELKARNRLQEFIESQQISYVDFLPIFKKFEPSKSLYRDHIHLSPQGNKLVSDRLSLEIKGLGIRD